MIINMNEQTARRPVEIFTAETGYTNVSERYRAVPTAPLAEKFKSLGFTVDSFIRRGCRDADKTPYVKHQVRLSHSDLLQNQGNRDIRLQLIITNSFECQRCILLLTSGAHIITSRAMGPLTMHNVNGTNCTGEMDVLILLH